MLNLCLHSQLLNASCKPFFLSQNVPSTLALRLWSHSLRPVSHYFHHQQKETKITESIAFSISTTVTPNEQQTRNSVTFGVTSVVFSAQGAARHEGNNRRRFGQVASIKRGLSPGQKYAKYTRGRTMLGLVCEYWFCSFDVISPALCHQHGGFTVMNFW